MSKPKFNSLISALCLALMLAALSWTGARPASANVGQEYGFGPQTAGLAGAGAAWGFGAFAAYNNPAGLPFQGGERLKLQIGLIAMQPDFIPITNIVTQNNVTSDGINYSDVDTDYRATLGQQLGIVYRLFPDAANLTFGLVGFLPLEQIAYMDTGETYVPEYVLYRARTQRPQLELAFGADITPRLHVGAGLHLAFTLTSAGTVFLQVDPAKPSTMRFSSSLKPKVAPQFGFLYTSETLVISEPPRFTFGGVVRLPVASDNALFLKSAGRFLGSSGAGLDFHFDALSSLFYDPLTIELGASFLTLDNARTYVQLDWQGWSKFEPPALQITNPTNENCDVSGGPCAIPISPGNVPRYPYRNIVVPRAGQEIRVGSATYRFGLAYRPSIFADEGDGPSGVGNYLDPSKVIVTAGLGYRFNRFLHFDVPCTVDFNFALHRLLTQSVIKTPGDENGNAAAATDLKIGSPGYEAGGIIYGGGLSLSLAF